MIVLVNLPKSLVVPVLSEWIDIFCFALFVSALQKKGQSYVQLLIEDYPHHFQKLCEEEVHLSSNWLLWFEKYPLCQIRACLNTNNLMQISQPSLASSSFGRLHCLELNRLHDVTLISRIVKMSTHLHELILDMEYDLPYFDQVEECLPLKVLRVKGSTFISRVVPLLRHCPVLAEVHCDTVIRSPMAIARALCVWCRQLTVLNIGILNRYDFVFPFHASRKLCEINVWEPNQLDLWLHYRGPDLKVLSISVRSPEIVQQMKAVQILAPNITKLVCDIKVFNSDTVEALNSVQTCQEIVLKCVNCCLDDCAPLLVNRRISLISAKGCWWQRNIFSEISNVSGLQTLFLNKFKGCKLLDENDLISLANHCPLLTYLNLFSFPLTDRGLGSIIANKKLKILNVNACSGLTEQTFKNLSIHCLDLNKLYIFSVVVYEDVLWMFLNSCIALRVLWFTPCIAVTDKMCAERIPKINKRLKYSIDRVRSGLQ